MSSKKQVWTSDLLHAPHEVADKAGRVRRMFNAIAPRYELVNAVFSVGRDASWRRRAVNMARVRAEDNVLDVACGTGDFARAFAAVGPRGVVGCDFAWEMLARTRGREVRSRAHWCQADALHLPFRDRCFSIVSCAFGIRNFASLGEGLAEMFRVLAPGGRAVILEFTRPKARVIRALYEFYANRIMPIGASLLAGDKSGAYRYLPSSVVSFPGPQELLEVFRGVGFVRCKATPLSLGVVTVYLAWRE